MAASGGHEQCATLLLEHGADRNARNTQGRVPPWEALSRGHHAAAQLLMDAGEDLSSGDAALYARASVEAGDLALLQDLARHGEDVTVACWDDGATALHRAVIEGNAAMTRPLLERDTDPDREDGTGRTPRALADELGHRDVQLLFSASRQEAAEESPAEQQGPAADHGGRLATAPPMVRYKSAPAARAPHRPRDSVISSPVVSGQNTPRRMLSFRNSLFGVFSLIACEPTRRRQYWRR